MGPPSPTTRPHAAWALGNIGQEPSDSWRWISHNTASGQSSDFISSRHMLCSETCKTKSQEDQPRCLEKLVLPLSSWPQDPSGNRRSLITFNATVNACEKAEAWKAAADMYHKVQEANLSPNSITCGATVSAFEKGRQWQLAVAALHEFCAGRTAPNLIICNAVISACEKSEQWQYALLLASQLSNFKLQPSIVTCSALVSACARCGYWQMALGIFDDFVKSKLQANVLALLASCGKSKAYTVMCFLTCLYFHDQSPCPEAARSR